MPHLVWWKVSKSVIQLHKKLCKGKPNAQKNKKEGKEKGKEDKPFH
jgi:hypothetical protein